MDIISLKDTSNKLFYVGGVVRDELLGIKSLDVDIVYEGNAIDDCSSFGDLVRVNPDFGTIRVKLDGREVDIASTRTEKYPRKGGWTCGGLARRRGGGPWWSTPP